MASESSAVIGVTSGGSGEAPPAAPAASTATIGPPSGGGTTTYVTEDGIEMIPQAHGGALQQRAHGHPGGVVGCPWPAAQAVRLVALRGRFGEGHGTVCSGRSLERRCIINETAYLSHSWLRVIGIMLTWRKRDRNRTTKKTGFQEDK